MVLALKDKILVISKKCYAGGEVTDELLITDNQDISCQIIITHKKGKSLLELGAKYTLQLVKED